MKIQFLLLPVILGCKNPVDIVTDIHREVNDAVYRPFKEHVIDPVIDPIDDAIFDPINDAIGIDVFGFDQFGRPRPPGLNNLFG